MAKPKICYQNLLESASSITVTDSTSGFEKELAYDWNTYDGWKASSTGTVYYTVDLGSAMPVDYWASAAHTLGTNSGSIKLQYSSDNFSADTNDFAAAVSPSNDEVMFQTVATAISARYWRWEITSTPVSFFGTLSLGQSLEMVRAVKQGFMLPKEARNNKIMNYRTEGGAFLGRSIIQQGVKFTYDITFQTLAFVRGDWSTFLDHAELKPFFFAWNPDYTADVVYAWMVGDPKGPAYDTNTTLRASLSMEAIK